MYFRGRGNRLELKRVVDDGPDGLGVSCNLICDGCARSSHEIAAALTPSVGTPRKKLLRRPGSYEFIPPIRLHVLNPANRGVAKAFVKVAYIRYIWGLCDKKTRGMQPHGANSTKSGIQGAKVKSVIFAD